MGSAVHLLGCAILMRISKPSSVSSEPDDRGLRAADFFRARRWFLPSTGPLHSNQRSAAWKCLADGHPARHRCEIKASKVAIGIAKVLTSMFPLGEKIG